MTVTSTMYMATIVCGLYSSFAKLRSPMKPLVSCSGCLRPSSASSPASDGISSACSTVSRKRSTRPTMVPRCGATAPEPWLPSSDAGLGTPSDASGGGLPRCESLPRPPTAPAW